MKLPSLIFSALIGAVASARSMTPMAALATARLAGRRMPGQLILLDYPVVKLGAVAMAAIGVIDRALATAPIRAEESRLGIFILTHL